MGGLIQADRIRAADLCGVAGSILDFSRLMDKFLWFCLPNEDKAALKPYISPPGEASIFRDIPIDRLAEIKAILQKVGRFRVIYRGPRGRYHSQAMTWKKDANRFAVYPAL